MYTFPYEKVIISTLQLWEGIASRTIWTLKTNAQKTFSILITMHPMSTALESRKSVKQQSKRWRVGTAHAEQSTTVRILSQEGTLIQVHLYLSFKLQPLITKKKTFDLHISSPYKSLLRKGRMK